MESTVFALILKLLTVAGLVVANGFFVAAEFSLVSVRRTLIRQRVAEGNAVARVVLQAIAAHDRFIAGTHLGTMSASRGQGWVGGATRAEHGAPVLGFLPPNLLHPAAHTRAPSVAFGLITFLHVVPGELTPKSVALQYPEQTAFFVARPTVWTENIFRPFIWLLNGTGNLLLQAMGLQTPSGHERVHSIEELKMLVKASQEAGALQVEEQEMLYNVFEFGQRQVHEAMIPRPEIVGVEQSATLNDLLQTFRQSSHARFPVYDGDLDDIVGFVAIKDVLLALADRPGDVETNLRDKDLIRPVYFAPETKRIDALFREMRQQQVQMAVIIDEYGGTAGVVTLEELMEEIVGRVSDELVREPARIEHIDECTVQIDAQLHVDDINDELGLGLPESDEYETLAGFILFRLRNIPAEGDTLRYRDLQLTVPQMRGPKIERVQITRMS